MDNLRLQIVLIVITAISLIIIIRIASKSRMEIKDAINWFFIVILLVLFAVFPAIVYFISSLVGIEVPSNAVFSIIIAILLIIVFYLNIRISKISLDLRRVVQELAVLEEKLKNDLGNDA